MAYHRDRGGSQGRGSSSGGFRGRGRGGGPRGGNRGGFASRGRGRGRGKPIYDSARLAQQKEEYVFHATLSWKYVLTLNRQDDESSESDSPSEQEEEAISEADSSDESDDEPAAPIKSYSALMQSLSADAPPQAKRRKIQHDSVTNRISENGHQVEAETTQDDDVDEAEEGPETATEGVLEDEDDEAEDASDPFEAHFANPDENILSQRLKALQNNHWTCQKSILPGAGKALLGLPMSDVVSKLTTKAITGPDGLKLKQKLGNVMSNIWPKFDSLEQAIAPLIFSYQDMLFCERSVKNAENLRRLTCLHAVNHIFKLASITYTSRGPLLTLL